jgi:GNAT superfamily N-acetyltransferase
MHESARATVEQWWRDVFNVDDELWSSVTVVHPHGLLGDYEGWYVAWRDAGVHVSAPSSAAAADVASLANETAASLREASFWQAFAHQRGLDMLGPSTHHYLDVDPGPTDGVVGLTVDQLAQLQTKVRPEEWVESGMAYDPPPRDAFGILRSGQLVAASVLSDWRDVPSDVGVLVDPAARGHGLATTVGRHAASYAVRAYGIARWRALTTNAASLRTAERIGFEPYATQLAIRRGSSGA